MSFPFTKDTILDTLQKGIAQTQIDETLSVLKSKKHNVCELVDLLGPALCAKENDVRSIGTQFFVDILKSLDSNDLNEQEVQVIWGFFSDRLNENHSIIPIVLSGGLILCKNQKLSHKSFAEFLRKMFLCVVCQTQKREDREKIFEMLQIASESNAEEFKQMGADWIYGVINALEGERDPRNLLFIFKFMPNFIQNYPLFHLTEEMFEVFAVYFPVDFTPSQSDPSAITRDLLAEHLANCLCASSDFLDNCIELIQEKLSSDLKAAKIDCLQLLIKWAQNSPSDKLERHFKDIWDTIKVHALSTKSDELKELTLLTIKNLMTNFSKDDQTSQNAATLILSTTMPSISDINSTSFESCIDIIGSCVTSSDKMSLIFVSKVLPTLISHYRLVTDAQKVKVITSIELLCKVLHQKNIISQLNHSDLELLEKEIMYILTNENSFLVFKTTIETVKHVAKIIHRENRLVIYSKLVELATNATCDEIILCISKTITSFDSEFKEEVPQFVLDPLKMLATTNSNPQPMKLLVNLMFSENFQENLTNFVFQYVLDVNNEVNLRLETLRYLLGVLETKKSDVTCQNSRIIDDIILFLQRDQDQSEFPILFTNLLEILVAQSDIEAQKIITSKYLSQLNPEQKSNLYIFKGILGHFDPNIPLGNHFEALSSILVRISSSTENKENQDLCNHLLCSLFNKVPDDDLFKVFVKNTLENIKMDIQQGKEDAVKVFSWISKALLMRGYEDGGVIVETLVELLNEPSKSHLAVLAFEILTIETPNLHLPNEKYLYKQKLISNIMKKLENRMTDLTEDHVTALLLIMKILPMSVLKINIEKFGTILIKGLNLKDSRCVLASLNILRRFIAEQNEYFTTYVSHIVEKLLSLSAFGLSMKIRIEALECLTNLTAYPTYLLLPYKDEVSYGVIPALDDAKRLVRNAAGKTRLKWSLIGAPED